jgi:hypothetical protein
MNRNTMTRTNRMNAETRGIPSANGINGGPMGAGTMGTGINGGGQMRGQMGTGMSRQ